MLESSPAGRDDKPTHAGIGENDISGDGETYRYCWGSCLTPTYALLVALFEMTEICGVALSGRLW